MSTVWAGSATATVVGLVATPYLARLTITVPDAVNSRWYRGASPDRRRLAWTAAVAVAVFALAGAAAGLSAETPALLALALTGTPLVVIDYEHHRLPDRLVGALALAGVVLLAAAAAVRHDWDDYLRCYEAAAAVFAVLFALRWIARGAFGGGDVALGAGLALYLGFHGWTAVYYGIFAGFLLGSVVSFVLLALRRTTMSSHFAFGPMMLFGALLVLLLDSTTTLVR